MKIYLAARYSRHKELREYAKALVCKGHTITSRWIQGGHQIDDKGLSAEADKSKRELFALEDLVDLEQADICISFTETPRSCNSRGGRHVEFGIALALKKRCVIVGPRECVFHCLPTVEVYQTFKEVLKEIKYEDHV